MSPFGLRTQPISSVDMSLNYGRPFLPRVKNTEYQRIGLVCSSLPVLAIALQHWGGCPNIPALPTLMVVWFVSKLVGDLMEMYWNIPSNMTEKSKLVEENPQAKLICSIKDFVSLGFLIFSIVCFLIIAPEFGEWGGGKDQVRMDGRGIIRVET